MNAAAGELVYSVEALSPEIEQAFARLFPPEDMKTPELLRWRFASSPGGPGRIAVARDPLNDGRIVGLTGLIAQRMTAKGQPIRGYQAVDVMVDPAYRGRGIFAGLARASLEHAEQQGAAMLWGFPNDNAAHGWFNRFGWVRFGTAPFLIRPMRTGYFLRRLSPHLGKLDVPLASGQSSPVEAIQRFGPEFDELWEQISPSLGCAVERGCEYLNWRLLDRPGQAYRNVVQRDRGGKLEAFVSSCVLDKHDGRILYIMEALGRRGDEKALSKLLRSEVARSAAKGADVALAWCPRGAWNRRALRQAGFLPFPDWLRPVRIHFGARLFSEDLPADVKDGSGWFLSYADSDTV